MRKTRTRVVLLNLALIAAGLRAWLSPWLAPGEPTLLDLVQATGPLGLGQGNEANAAESDLTTAAADEEVLNSAAGAAGLEKGYNPFPLACLPGFTLIERIKPRPS